MQHLMHTIESSQLVPTHGLPVALVAMERALAHHQAAIRTLLSYHKTAEAMRHERCCKWLALGLQAAMAGLQVTKELYVGYYLNEGRHTPALIGCVERTAAEYHAAILGLPSSLPLGPPAVTSDHSHSLTQRVLPRHYGRAAARKPLPV